MEKNYNTVSDGKIKSRIFDGIPEIDRWLSITRNLKGVEHVLDSLKPLLFDECASDVPISSFGILRKRLRVDSNAAPLYLTYVKNRWFKVDSKPNEAVIALLKTTGMTGKMIVSSLPSSSTVIRVAPFVAERAVYDANFILSSEFGFGRDGEKPKAPLTDIAKWFRKYSRRARVLRAERERALGDVSSVFLGNDDYSVRYESAEGLCTVYTSKREVEKVLDVRSFRETFGDFGVKRCGVPVFSETVFSETVEELRAREKKHPLVPRFVPLDDGFYSFYDLEYRTVEDEVPYWSPEPRDTENGNPDR